MNSNPTNPLWTGADVIAATNAVARGSDWNSSGVSIDSRTLEAGDLFVAIKGPHVDGHDFVDAAFEAGAAAAIVANDWSGESEGELLRVPDPLEALNDFARAARARITGTVAAITGSVGKTGTKNALAAALGRYRPAHASAASYNNLWGVPLSLARMPATTKFGVFEIGMNHAGEIRPLTKMVRPNLAIITTVEPVHLEYFSSVADIADAKAEIFEGMEPGGVAVLNRDNAYFDRLADRARASGVDRIIGFGETENADARLIKAVRHAECSCVSADICGQPMTFKVSIPGHHWVMNSLAVLAAVSNMGGDLGLAGLALAELEAPVGRGRRYNVQLADRSIELIDESYNANPASMESAIKLLGAAEPGRGGRRIAVLGDMRELGFDSPEYHKALASPLKEAGIDLVFAAGLDMAHLFKALPTEMQAAHVAMATELAPLVMEIVREGDVVMVKGSLASGMAEIVEAIRAVDTAHDETDSATRRANGMGA